MATFEIRRPYPGPNISLQVNSAMVRGTPVMVDTTTPTSAALAGSGAFVGFLTRAVTATGPTVSDHIFSRIELDAKVGDYVSIEKADALEVEGTDFIYSGTGQIADGTSKGTELSFLSGKFRQKQTGETPYYRLAAVLTPETAGNLRIAVEAIR